MHTHTHIYMTKIYFYSMLYLCAKLLDISEKAYVNLRLELEVNTQRQQSVS